jgi:pyruvate dehydrogenase E2 component (dihydrolipoamide acetyltransferase)
MTATDVISVDVPDIGDFDDVPVIEILVTPGANVALDDPLVTLESDKATMDVPAPVAGVVNELRVNVGDRVSQGTQLLTMTPTDVADAPSPAQTNDASLAATQSLPDTAPPAAVPPPPAPVAGPPPAVPAAPQSAGAQRPVDASAPPAPSTPHTDGRPALYASPAVRRLARELHVDLRAVPGTGRKGRITKDDLQAFVQRPPASAAPATGGLSLAPWPALDFERFGPVERVELTRIQRISVPNLARNWVMIPHVTHNDEADITELEAWRKQLNDEHAHDGVKITMVSFLILACVTTLKEHPRFNSSLDGDELILKRYYNIGFAADTPAGLVVPVIRDADGKGLLEVARELTELSGRAREGKLAPADIQGGTFTISSLGGIGGTSFTPIVNAPEVAILGVTRATTKPIWNGREFAPRLMLPLSLSYDHRAIDGAAAARFVVALGKVLGDLRRALL